MKKIILAMLVLGVLAGVVLVRKSVTALNKVNNWNFNGDATGWSSTNGTGTDTCGGSGVTAESTFPTFAYNANIGGQTGWQGVTGTVKNINHRGMIYQTITAPGSGTVKAKGNLSLYANAASWAAANTSWIRLDVYDSGNSNYIANVGCTSFNSNQAWKTLNFSSDIGFTGGITYTLRVTLRSRNPTSNGVAVTVAVDNIIVNFAPVGLAGTAPVDTTNVQLDWTASVGGTGALGLNSTSPYNVYRDLASPVSSLLTSATTNSYTDSTTEGNLVYYYAVSDVDTTSVESPLSAEVNILTRPGAPGTPTFTGIGDTYLTVNWTEPTNGADSYKVERCSGAACSNFSGVASGVVGTTYADTSLSAATLYRYQLRATNTTGDGSLSGIGETSTVSAIAISLVVSDGSVAFNYLGLGTSQNTTSLGTNDPEYVRVDAGPATLEARSTNFTQDGYTWFLNTGNGTTQVQWEFSKDGSAWTTFGVADSLYGLENNVGTGLTRPVFFRLTMPTSTDSYLEYSSTVTIVASAP